MELIRKERDAAEAELEDLSRAQNIYNYREQENTARLADLSAKFEVLHHRWEGGEVQKAEIIFELRQEREKAEEARCSLLQENQTLKAQLEKYEEKGDDELEEQVWLISEGRDTARDDLENLTHAYGRLEKEYRFELADAKATGATMSKMMDELKQEHLDWPV